MSKRNRVFLIAVLAIGFERTKLTPGFNVFSPDQDVEIGQQVSKEAENQLRLVRNGLLHIKDSCP